MPLATYIRGTKFDSHGYEIKEYVVDSGRLMMLLSMKNDPGDMGLREEIVKEINTAVVGNESMSEKELVVLAESLDEKYKEKGLRFVMGLINNEEILVMGVLGEVYLWRKEKRGKILSKSKDVMVRKGAVRSGDIVLLSLGEGVDEIVAGISKGMVASRIEDDLETPSCGAILRFDEMESTDREDNKEEESVGISHIDISDGTKKKKPTTKKRTSGVWNKWMSHIQKKSKTVNPEIYVKSDERKRLGIVVLFVFFLLILSVGIGWRKRRVDEKNAQFNQIYEPSLQLLIEAERLSEESVLESREKLLEAKMGIEQILSEYEGDENEKEKLETLLLQVNELYETVSGEHEVSEASLYYDLSLVKEDVYGEEMSLADGWITVLDESRGVVLGVEVESKKAKLLAGGEIISGAKLLSSSGGKAVVLSNKGLVGVFYNDRTAEVLLETDDSWKNPTGLGMFGGNVYVMDGDTSEVWRYPGYEGGVGSGVRWLGPGVVPNFYSISGVAVDGDIWISTLSGNISRFRRGAQMNFDIDGLTNPLSKAEAIYTQAESEQVYILDRENERVVIVTKDGEYADQYKWEGIKAVTDMVVVEKDEGESIILLLSGSSIYEIPIER